MKITDGARRFLCLEGNDELSQKAVDEGRCDRETRREYMAKPDRTKNDEDVAYEFFRYCVLLDLSGFQVDEPPRTGLIEEQREHNECAFKRFLADVTSGAYPLEVKSGDFCVQRLHGEHKFTALELFGHLKRYKADTGAQTDIDSVMALGISLARRHARLAPKVEERITKYKIRIAEE